MHLLQIDDQTMRLLQIACSVAGQKAFTTHIDCKELGYSDQGIECMKLSNQFNSIASKLESGAFSFTPQTT